MYTYIYIYIFIHIYIYTYICMFMYVYVYTYAAMQLPKKLDWTRQKSRVCVYAYICHIYTSNLHYLHKHIMHAYIYACIHMNMRMYTYINALHNHDDHRICSKYECVVYVTDHQVCVCLRESLCLRVRGRV